MSNVFRALEKAEREKQIHPVKAEPLIGLVDAKPFETKNNGPILKDLAKEIEKFDLPVLSEDSISVAENSSFAAEQFRKMKTHIFRISPAPPRCILVTSTVPQEGKSTITMNLAMSIAQEMHKKVIVIDADLRNPSIYPTKFANKKGLSDYLSDETPISEVLKSFNGERYVVIPAGAPSHKAAELVGSNKMKALIKALRDMDQETFILIDSPPILATSEPLMLSEWVDGVILVVGADHAPRGSIKKAFGGIDPGKIIGIVFNNKNLKPSKDYSDYYYRYHKK
jgi:non-specific protein-tyrosine kinase